MPGMVSRSGPFVCCWWLGCFLVLVTVTPLALSQVRGRNASSDPTGTQRQVEGVPERIEIEVVFDPRARLQNGAQWAKMLSDVGFDRASLRQATASDEIGFQQKAFAGRPMLMVTGGIVRDRLVLPGLEARLTQPDLVRQWLAALRQGQLGGPSQEEVAGAIAPEPAAHDQPFGLSDQELVELAEHLSAPVSVSTASLKNSERLEALQRTSPVMLVPSLDTAKALARESNVAMELKGLSVGTALAAFGRPLGLVLVPEKSASGQLHLSLQPSAIPAEYWPVGWPTQLELVDLAPQMGQHVDLDLRGQTMAEACQLVAGQAGVPVLLDRNSLLAGGVDVDQKVSGL